MTFELAAGLSQLELVLARANAAIVERLLPGAEAETVRAALHGLGLSPTPELLAWFGWHDGAGGAGTSSDSIEIAPGAEFYDVGSLCVEYTTMRRITNELASTAGYPFESGELWRPSWFPLLRLFGKGLVAVDLSVVGSPVHVVWHDDDPEARGQVVWPNLADLVEFLLSNFEAGTYSVDEHGLVRGPTLDRTHQADDAAEILGELSSLLRRYGRDERADFVAQLIEDRTSESFWPTVAGPEFWGGSGAVWEVEPFQYSHPDVPTAVSDHRRFQILIVRLAEILDARDMAALAARSAQYFRRQLADEG